MFVVALSPSMSHYYFFIYLPCKKYRSSKSKLTYISKPWYRVLHGRSIIQLAVASNPRYIPLGFRSCCYFRLSVVVKVTWTHFLSSNSPCDRKHQISGSYQLVGFCFQKGLTNITFNSFILRYIYSVQCTIEQTASTHKSVSLLLKIHCLASPAPLLPT